jgi:hypothetical protein
METMFLVCAALGGTVLVIQLVLALMGIGADHDLDDGGGADVHVDGSDGDAHDGGGAHGGNWFLGVLTFKTAIAALTFFGIGGKIAMNSGADDWAAVGIAIACGAAALYLVGMLMRSLHKMKSDGTARIERAVGHPATVYLRIPGSRAGAGKVHLNLQNRTVEYQAVTPGAELPTGAQVKVIAVVNADTVEVELA